MATAYSQPDESTKWQVYYDHPDNIPTSMANLLQSYSHIPQGQEQLDHVVKIRNQAYKSHPYPCLGRFRFLQLDLASHPLYKTEILPRMTPSKDDKQAPIFLDLGTCLGQDLRKLLHDTSAPLTTLFGSDIVPAFIDAGYALFNDSALLPRSQFLVPADVFDTSPENTLSVLDGKVDILHVTAVFHLFAEAQQRAVAERCLRLLRKEEGTRGLILGAQVGNVAAEEREKRDGTGMWRHSEETWKGLWEEVVKGEEFKEAVRGVEVSVEMQMPRLMGNDGGGAGGGGADAAEKGPDADGDKDGNWRTLGGTKWMVWSVWVSF